MTADACLPIFVYGTLQRGEEREHCWPRRPRCIEWATVIARLYDLGAYPALVEGDDLVLGELWHVERDDLDATLVTLDEIEGYGQDADNLYVRTVVQCRTMAGQAKDAFLYSYAKPHEIAGAAVVMPDRDGVCRWTKRDRRSGREWE
jgi:gamma-glutamylcyclotransferase (GGCT)/AIG2-like uncharacterized protein YtfP